MPKLTECTISDGPNSVSEISRNYHRQRVDSPHGLAVVHADDPLKFGASLGKQLAGAFIPALSGFTNGFFYGRCHSTRTCGEIDNPCL